MATRRVRLGLLLTEIGQSNNIQVSEDIKRTVIEQSSRFPRAEREVIQFYQNNPDEMQQLAGPMFEELVMGCQMAKVTDVEITAEELYAEPVEKATGKGARSLNLRLRNHHPKRTSPKKTATEEATPQKAVQKKKPVAKKKGDNDLIRFIFLARR